jgi:hypothetical protein
MSKALAQSGLVKKNELILKNVHMTSSVYIEKSPRGNLASNVMLFDKGQNLRSNITDL